MVDQRELFGAYDIRGMYGDALNVEFAKKLGDSYGRFLSPQGGGRFAVGFDSRNSSPALAAAFISGIVRSGNDAVDIGLASTPLTDWYGAANRLNGSVVVTASHLSKEFNGFKLYRENAIPIGSRNGLRELADLIGESSTPAKKPGTVVADSPLDGYIQHLLGFLRPGKRRLKVAVDAGNGAGGPEADLFSRLCQAIDVFAIDVEPDGEFPNRSPNPLDEGALARLAEVVVAEHCDFGIAFDGDADRAIFVDECGVMVQTDIMLGLLGGYLVERSPGGTVVYDLRSSRAVPEYIEQHGGRAVRTGVGNTFIKTSMLEEKAIFAGELSGHYYYADLFDTDNAMRTLIEVANIMSTGHQTLSERIKPLSKYPTSGEINLKVNAVAEVLERLEASISGGMKEYIDGLSVSFPKWWFAARGSQTEPVLRLTVGAVDSDILEKQTRQLIGVINQAN